MTAAPEDIAAMRADGDLLDYIRSLTGRPAKSKPAATEPEQAAYPARARVGAWPYGTRSPGPYDCSGCRTGGDAA
jgi:hypothetical protein